MIVRDWHPCNYSVVILTNPPGKHNSDKGFPAMTGTNVSKMPGFPQFLAVNH